MALLFQDDNSSCYIQVLCQTQTSALRTEASCQLEGRTGDLADSVSTVMNSCFHTNTCPLWIITHQIRLTYYCLPLYSLLPRAFASIFPLTQASPFCWSLFRVPLSFHRAANCKTLFDGEQPAEGALSFSLQGQFWAPPTKKSAILRPLPVCGLQSTWKHECKPKLTPETSGWWKEIWISAKQHETNMQVWTQALN